MKREERAKLRYARRSMTVKPDFNSTARKLIKNKIHFTTRAAEPRFEILGERFTTQELIHLDQQNKLTNFHLSEIIRAKRMTSAGKVGAARISSNES
jgi:hypothetical protein